MSTYFNNLIKTVIDNSKSKTWDAAVLEWTIIDVEEDIEADSSCICGKTHIRYLYTIYNMETHKQLKPIGSCCIKKFKRKDLNAEISTLEKLYELVHAVLNKEFITLEPKYFSRNVLKYLYEKDVFKGSYDKDGTESYEFMLKMFNKKDKKDITKNQQKKITAIILNQIFPYCKNTLKFSSKGK